MTTTLEYVFNNGNSNYISVDYLTNAKAIVCYRNSSNNSYGTACILDIENNTITPGSEVVFNNGNSNYISVSRLTDTKAIVCYRDDSNNSYETACVLDINNNTITAGSKVVFNNGSSHDISVNYLTNTKAIVYYTNDSYSGTACILNIDDKTITAGNEAVFNSEGSRYVSSSRLTDTKAIVCYSDYSNGGYGTACVLDINNNTITPGSEVVFNNGSSYDISVDYLTDTKAIVCYRDYDNSGCKTARILNIEDNTITPGSGVVFSSGASFHISVSRLTDDKAVVCYEDNDNNRHGTACILNIDNDTITPGSTVVFSSGSINEISVSRLTDTKAIVCYTDVSNDNYGTSTILYG